MIDNLPGPDGAMCEDPMRRDGVEDAVSSPKTAADARSLGKAAAASPVRRAVSRSSATSDSARAE
ncbi:hypothetical protein [Sphingomonas sp. BK235]|uniref:hypothetical protein n=1 Tax=Sphingomonas sp. BK235 TaxID=2512131 RepID=UPI001404E06D|nr:hypothetical protein [Sphingomonas sp. BK235]